MKVYDLVLSNKLSPRIARHVLFWLVRFLFLYLWFLSISFITARNPPVFTSKETVSILLFFLFLDMVYCYPVVYWLVPGYLVKRKYLSFGSFALIIALILFILKYFLWLQFSGESNQPVSLLLFMLWMNAINFVTSGPPVICGLFLAIKMLKTWYINEEEQLILVRENANAELQLLKAQVHPHFLFNTLNNIYSFILSKSPLATELIAKLSGTLHYMMFECKTARVPLEKELKMIRDYIELEKVRYGQNLLLQFEIIGNCQDKQIPPLLLIPFIENSFKHGASKTLENPWIRLRIQVEKELLHFYLDNSKPGNPGEADPDKSKKGIGLSNVQKRLQLLYPGDENLKIKDEQNSYSVRLWINLQRQFSNIRG